MKNHHHNGPVEPSANSREQIHAAIAARAYELWEKHGRPANEDVAHWLEAEHALTAERTSPPSPARKP